MTLPPPRAKLSSLRQRAPSESIQRIAPHESHDFDPVAGPVARRRRPRRGGGAEARRTAAKAAKPTAADADAFIAAAEKDLFDYTVEASQVNWVNSTYLTEDTDAMAARINAVGTEKSVKYALEAAKYKDVAGLSADTKRKLDILRNGLVLPAPTKPGAATELNQIATDLQSQYGKGRGTLNGKEISGSDIEAADGQYRADARRTRRNVDQLARQCRRADEGRLCAPGRHRQRRREGAGLRQHRRDVALGL